MIRRHLALSIALASMVTLLAGGLAYASLTSETKVTACVTAQGFVRSATYSSRCPYRSTAVEVASQADLATLQDDLQAAEQRLAVLRTPPQLVRQSASLRAGGSLVGYTLSCPVGKFASDPGYSVAEPIDVLSVGTDHYTADNYPTWAHLNVKNTLDHAVAIEFHVTCMPIPQ